MVMLVVEPGSIGSMLSSYGTSVRAVVSASSRVFRSICGICGSVQGIQSPLNDLMQYIFVIMGSLRVLPLLMEGRGGIFPPRKCDGLEPL